FIVRATKPEGSRCIYVIDAEKKQQVEIYDHARFWTITGRHYNQQSSIGDGEKVVEWICKAGDQPPQEPQQTPVSRVEPIILPPLNSEGIW
ncbi:MAG: hypothetical protein ABGZ35_33360, partial [Planctomycetaceae bacterium]